jgi:hypothetical protein
MFEPYAKYHTIAIRTPAITLSFFRGDVRTSAHSSARKGAIADGIACRDAFDYRESAVSGLTDGE